jgi:hypothetical protein
MYKFGSQPTVYTIGNAKLLYFHFGNSCIVFYPFAEIC